MRPRRQPRPPTPHTLPSAGTIAASGGAIFSQSLKLILGTASAVGNFFIVLFLGIAFATQPGVYRDGLLFMAPAKHRTRATTIVDRIGETLERWLIAQIITMVAVFLVTWIGLSIIGIQSSFILGIQAGLLAFIPTVGAILGGLIVVLASLASGWVAALSAFILFLGVHALESYVLTPMIQRQALNIPPATLFAFQILLGVVFGIWGLALALPLMAIAKVMIDHFKTEAAPAAIAAGLMASVRRGQHRLGMFDVGRRAKYGPTSARQAAKSSEPRKSTVWFSSVSHCAISR